MVDCLCHRAEFQNFQSETQKHERIVVLGAGAERHVGVYRGKGDSKTGFEETY